MLEIRERRGNELRSDVNGIEQINFIDPQLGNYAVGATLKKNKNN